MTAFRRLVQADPMLLIWPLCVFLLVWIAGWVVRRFTRRVLTAWTARTHSRFGVVLGEAIHGPFLIWTVMLGVHLAVQASRLPVHFTQWSAKALLILWITSLTLLGMRIAGDLVRNYGSQVAGGVLPVTTLTQNLAQLAVVLVGAAVLLQELGLKITPYLTALGVGGLAVALALQDTLSNLFSGFYVAVAGQIRLGDYIKLNTGEEGYVSDIGWRSTIVRSLGSNLVFIPNAKLSQAIVTNYHLPNKHMGVGFAVNVCFESDIDQVERVLLEELQGAAAQVQGMVADPPPSVTFDPGFGEFFLGFTVNYTIAEFASQWPVRHALRKRIYKRFAREGIRLPYPVRTIYLRDERTPEHPAESPGHERASRSVSGV
jgi:small-conductance mechanosensitive channel